MAPPPARLSPVVVAAHAIAAGHRLGPDDLAVAGWAPGTGPVDALHGVGLAAGRVASGPLARGDAVTEGDLLGPGVLTGLAPELLAVPVRVADSSTAALVRRGDRIDILVASGSSAAVVVSGVLVLADPDGSGSGSGAAAGDGSGLGLTGSGSGGSGDLSAATGSTGGGASLVVGLRLDDAQRLAQAQAAGPLSVAVQPR
jgi:pilus assembly protein CpaB